MRALRLSQISSSPRCFTKGLEFLSEKRRESFCSMQNVAIITSAVLRMVFPFFRKALKLSAHLMVMLWPSLSKIVRYSKCLRAVSCSPFHAGIPAIPPSESSLRPRQVCGRGCYQAYPFERYQRQKSSRSKTLGSTPIMGWFSCRLSLASSVTCLESSEYFLVSLV